jgi:putative membrane protein
MARGCETRASYPPGVEERKKGSQLRTKGVIDMMWWGWGGGGWVSWLLMSLMMLVFGGGIIALVVWAIRGGFGRPSGPRSDAESILEERFARGEISAEELESRRKVLRASRGQRAA